MKRLAALLIVLPLAALADVAPMSREEWERSRQFVRQISIDDMSSTDAGYMLAGLMGVCLSVCVFVPVKLCLHRRDSWRNFVSKASMEWVILTALILAGCLCLEVLFCPCSTFLSMVNGKSVEHHEQSRPNDESYEEYLFYERHCRKCGTALSYDKGRYCPNCNPRPAAHATWEYAPDLHPPPSSR